MEVGTKLKQLRNRNNLTLKELAERLNLVYGEKTVSLGKLSNWELNKDTPRLHDLYRLARFYNVTVDFLITRTEEDLEDEKIRIHTEDIKSLPSQREHFNIDLYKQELAKNEYVKAENKEKSKDKENVYIVEEKFIKYADREGSMRVDSMLFADTLTLRAFKLDSDEADKIATPGSWVIFDTEKILQDEDLVVFKRDNKLHVARFMHLEYSDAFFRFESNSVYKDTQYQAEDEILGCVEVMIQKFD